MTSPNDAPESLECNYSSTVLQHRVMTNNPTGLSFQQKINQENVVQSSHSSCDGNSCMITKINRSSTDVFDDNNAEGISAFGASSNMKPSFSYVDKSVMECQMSKTIVCDQEVNVNDVKDICIDDGVASLENFFFKSTAEKSISKISPLEEDRNEGSIKEKETSSEVSKFIADDRKVSLEDHFAMDWTTHNDAKDLTQIEEEKLNLSEPELLMQKLVKRSYSSESLDKIGLQVCIFLAKLLIMFCRTLHVCSIFNLNILKDARFDKTILAPVVMFDVDCISFNFRYLVKKQIWKTLLQLPNLLILATTLLLWTLQQNHPRITSQRILQVIMMNLRMEVLHLLSIRYLQWQMVEKNVRSVVEEVIL